MDKWHNFWACPHLEQVGDEAIHNTQFILHTLDENYESCLDGSLTTKNMVACPDGFEAKEHPPLLRQNQITLTQTTTNIYTNNDKL